MIRYYIGKPRSGKTYHLVKDINDKFLNSASSEFDKHKFLYTNIAGFKHDEINGRLLNYPIDSPEHPEGFEFKRTIHLNWDMFYKHLQVIYKIGDDDVKLIEYCKANRIYKAHIAIDECHRYFTKDDPVLVWWLGYHGHMGHEISFVTHNLLKVHAKYKLDSEIFLEAQPKSKAVHHKHLSYIEFAHCDLSKQQQTRSFSIMMKDSIHALYNSGDIHNPKSVIMPLLIKLAGAVALVIFAFSYMFKSIAPEPPKVESSLVQKKIPSSVSTKSPPKKIINENQVILYLDCTSSYCTNSDKSYLNYSYPYNFTHTILKNYAEFISIVKQNTVIFEGSPVETYTSYAYLIDKNIATNIFPDLFIKYVEPTREVPNDQNQDFKINDTAKALGGGVAPVEA